MGQAGGGATAAPEAIFAVETRGTPDGAARCGGFGDAAQGATRERNSPAHDAPGMLPDIFLAAPKRRFV
jgi:hypothetical protein